MKSDFLIAITQLAAERNLSQEIVLHAVEAALVSAFKKDHLADADLVVRFGQAGEVRVFIRKKVVEAVADSIHELTLDEARGIRKDAKIGDTIEIEATPSNAGRIAAQTAKQVVMQRLREAERELVYAEYAGKEGHVVSGVVQRMEGRAAIIDLGRAEAIMPPQEQVSTERYRQGQRLKIFILEVGKTPKGPQIVVSRTHKDLLRRLFELEVPEIFNGVVEIKSIAREPGFRSKVAVAALQDRVDAVGACVGLRGMRIQNIVNELHGEKIDVVEWVADPAAFIAKALGPAQVMQVILRRREGVAITVVPDRQLSLAIGREGQNARLAARLTGWRIDIKSATEAEQERIEKGTLEEIEEAPAPPPPAPATAPAAKIAVIEAPAPPAREPAPPAPVAVEARAPLPPGPEPAVKVAAGAATFQEAPLEEAEPGAGVEERELEPARAEEEREEAPLLAEALASEDTWKVPTPQPSRSGIRFAEDIAEYRGGGRGKRRGDRDDDRKKKGKR